MSDPIEDQMVANLVPQQSQPSGQIQDPIEAQMVANMGSKTATSKNTEPESDWSRLGHSAASLADTVMGMPGQVIKGVEYAGARAAGESPEQATQRANAGLGESLSNPVGDAFGVTNTSGYQGEGSRQIMNFIGQNVGKGAKWIAQQTGMPESDVNNLIQTASYALPSAISAVKEPVMGSVRTIGNAAKETAESDMVQPTPSVPEWQQVRNTYNESTPAPEAPDTPVSLYASGGSAATTVSARLSTATPELQQDVMAQIAAAKEKYGDQWQSHIDYDAIDRQLNADSLPVPGRLTAGQAAGSGPQISDEWNHRNVNGLGDTFAQQNQTQIANLQKIREDSAPDVFTNSPDTHADTLIKSYQSLYGQDKGAVDAKWDAIRSATQDGPIFDPSKIMQDAQAALKTARLTTIDPGGQLNELLSDIQQGGLTADGFVQMRQNLGATARAGGLEGKAASVVLDSINKSEMLPEAAQYRDMVNDALASGKALHDKLAADPAYNAVANGNASVKDFVQKYVIGGKPEEVANMRDNLAGDDIAQQTMRASLLDHLRTKSGINEQYQGDFGSKNFNNNLRSISPVGRVILNNGELPNLQALGDYSNHVTAGGRNSWKNFSNTATELQSPGQAMATTAGQIVGTGAEAALNVATHGAASPFIQMFKSGAKQRAAIKEALAAQEQAEQFKFNATRPAAGIIKE